MTKDLTLSLDVILCGPGNHHWVSHWLDHDFEHSYASVVQPQPTTLLHLVPLKPTMQHSVHQGNRSKASSKSTNANYKFFFFAKYFSCNILKMKMAFVVSHPGINPNCITVSTYCLVNLSIIPSAIYRVWSFNFSPL